MVAHHFVKMLEALAQQLPPDCRVVLLTEGRLTGFSLTFTTVAEAPVLVLGEHYDRAHSIPELIGRLGGMTKGKRVPVMVCDRLEHPYPDDESSREIHHFLTEPELGKVRFADDFFVVIRGRLPDSIQGKLSIRKTFEPIPSLTERSLSRPIGDFRDDFSPPGTPSKTKVLENVLLTVIAAIYFAAFFQ